MQIAALQTVRDSCYTVAAMGAQRSGPPPLSQRESEVLELILQGLTTREVGERLYLSVDTIKSHLRRIFQKYGVRSRMELARRQWVGHWTGRGEARALQSHKLPKRTFLLAAALATVLAGLVVIPAVELPFEENTARVAVGINETYEVVFCPQEAATPTAADATAACFRAAAAEPLDRD